MKPAARRDMMVGTVETTGGSEVVGLGFGADALRADPADASRRVVPMTAIDAMVLGVMLIGEGARLAGVEISPVELLQPLRDRGVVIA